MRNDCGLPRLQASAADSEPTRTGLPCKTAILLMCTLIMWNIYLKDIYVRNYLT